MEPWSLTFSCVAFAVASIATIVGGIRLARSGDMLADRTKLGEALFGAVFFGGVISASGIVMSAVAAYADQPQLAYTSAVGGIAAQTAALVVADMFYKPANLEHAAASLSNMMFAVLLIVLLLIALGVTFAPSTTVWAIHPGSFALVIAYVYGLKSLQQSRAEPGWLPKRTKATVEDEASEEGSDRSTMSLWVEFVTVGSVVAGGGWVIARAAEVFVEEGGIEASVVGAVFMGLVNATPEAVTSIAAVRRGALTLAVAGVLGGNAFDVLNLVVADVAYRNGSIYHAADQDGLFLITVSALLTAVILGGLLRRERQGPGKIGMESWCVLVGYLLAITVLALPNGD